MNLDNDTEFVPQKFEMPAQNLHQPQFEIPQRQSEIGKQQEISKQQSAIKIASPTIEPRISKPQPQQNTIPPKAKVKKRYDHSR